MIPWSVTAAPGYRLTPEASAFADSIRCELECPDCPVEVRVTFGARVYARVIHSGTCPWLPRYLAGELSQRDGDFVGAIPCGVASVTHRGPYRCDPQGGAS